MEGGSDVLAMLHVGKKVVENDNNNDIMSLI